MFRAIKRLFVWFGLMAEKVTETDAINEAQVEAGIRKEQANCQKCFDALAQIKANALSLKDQIKGEKNKELELTSLVQAAIQQGSEDHATEYAAELAELQESLRINEQQLTQVDSLYTQTKDMLANHIQELKRFQREFDNLKARVKISRSLEGLAEMTQSMLPQFQGAVGGEMSKSMEQLRQTAYRGQAKMETTSDLAQKVGADISMQKEARKIRGRAILDQIKAKMAEQKSQDVTTTTAAPVKEERQRISAS